MATVGFHLSSGKLRYVRLTGSKSSPLYAYHKSRPLELTLDRREFAKNALDLFHEILSAEKPDRIGYLLSMEANSQVQIASLIFPFAMLNLCALDFGISTHEYIAPNFSKSFFKSAGLDKLNKYEACNALVGAHPPNWTNSERLAALAAWGQLS